MGRTEKDIYFHSKTQLSIKYIPINIKMRTIASILILKSRINIVLGVFKLEHFKHKSLPPSGIGRESVCVYWGGGGLLGEGEGEVHKDKKISEQANMFAGWKVTEKCGKLRQVPRFPASCLRPHFAPSPTLKK